MSRAQCQCQAGWSRVWNPSLCFRSRLPWAVAADLPILATTELLQTEGHPHASPAPATHHGLWSIPSSLRACSLLFMVSWKRSKWKVRVKEVLQLGLLGRREAVPQAAPFNTALPATPKGRRRSALRAGLQPPPLLRLPTCALWTLHFTRLSRLDLSPLPGWLPDTSG